MSGMTITHSERGRDLWVSLGREWDENKGLGMSLGNGRETERINWDF